jgi:hypothetical protein
MPMMSSLAGQSLNAPSLLWANASPDGEVAMMDAGRMVFRGTPDELIYPRRDGRRRGRRAA